MAKLDPEWLEAMRKRIRDSQILDKSIDMATQLKAHVDGDKVMSKSQIDGAKAFAVLSKTLLAKVLPDMKAMEVTGADGGAVKVETIVIRAVDATDNRST